MTENNSDFALMLMSGAVAQQQIDEILDCNKTTAEYGLTLTQPQAAALAQTRSQTLRKTGRVEFGGSVINKLIMSFYNSPYISGENYEAVLHELIDLFYLFKNETSDMISDDALIEYMKKSFNGTCRGSLELLSARELPDLVKKLNNRRAESCAKDMEMTDD